MRRFGFWCCLRRSLLWGLLPLLLLFLLGWFFSHNAIQDKLAGRVKEKLAAAGAGWAGVEMDGRDATLSGDAPSRAARDVARDAALSVFGVRRVDDSRVKVVLARPTVEPARASRAPLVLSGKWKKAPGAALVVVLAGKTYELGKSRQLTSDAEGHWTLKLDKLPPDGVHDVRVEVVDNGARVADATSNELVVDTTPPAAPGLSPAQLPEGTGRLSGTMAPDTETMRITLAGKTYELGKSPELTTDGKGNWTLAITERLAPGTYDAEVVVADALGNRAEKTFKAAVVVPKPEPKPEPKPAPDTTPPAAPVVPPHRVKQGESALLAGTWPHDDAKSLKVMLAGKTYELGRDEALSATDGKWMLKVPAGLPAGTHEVIAEVADAAGNVARGKGTLTVVDATPPAAPVVLSRQVKEGEAVTLTGTWPHDDAKSLKVMLAGKTHELGRDEALSATDGKWTLKVPAGLPVGTHEVIAEVTDAAGNVARGKGTLTVVDATPPEAPTVSALKLRQGETGALQGTWPHKDAKKLKVVISGVAAHELGKSDALSAAGAQWVLKLPPDLPVGTHDVMVEVADAAGNVARDTTAGELVVLAPKDCQKLLSGLLKDQRIHFVSNSAEIRARSFPLLDAIANAVKDGCRGVMIEVSGHTDSTGRRAHNQRLSEARANAVVEALVQRGVPAEQLRAVGYGETRPVATNRTRAGRALNRRIEMRVIEEK